MLSLGACFSSHCTLLMRTFIHSRVRSPVHVSCIPHPLQWISDVTARWLYVYVCVCDCAQVCIILVITFTATGSVVTGLRSGLKTLSQVTFILGNILLFSLLFLDNTWYDAVSVVVTQCVARGLLLGAVLRVCPHHERLLALTWPPGSCSTRTCRAWGTTCSTSSWSAANATRGSS